MMTNLEYEAAVSSLFNRFPSFQNKGAEAYKPGLDRVRAICSIIGNPQDTFPSIHVAGTNGKGSCCNLLAAQLAYSGYRVGLFTSPHILDFRERMRVVSRDGVELISRQEVWDFLQRYMPDMERLDLSFFEISTVMAFWFMTLKKVNFAVVETGLGGRLDATNIITPRLSLITNIGYDHMDLLGNTLAKIAGEKAGIVKQAVPVVIGESHPETDPVFIAKASAENSPIVFADKKVKYKGEKALLEKMDLQGAYQAKNLHTVLCALEVLGMKADEQALAHAAGICDFHGRWEKLCDSPYTICDIGHNEHGLKYNFAQLETMMSEGQFSDLVMVYGSVKDKDVDAVLKILPAQAHLIFTAADSHRAMPADEILERSGRTDAKTYAGVEEAVKGALEYCRTLAKPLLYIGGSTYVVSEAVPALRILL